MKTSLNNIPDSYTMFASSFVEDCKKKGATVVWRTLDMRGCMIFDTLRNPNNVDIHKLLHDKWWKEFPEDA